VIPPPATVGVLGGGQLGRFFVLAAREHGYRTWVLDPDPTSPAGDVAHRHLVAALDDESALDEMGRECAAVTTEFENVPAASLERLATTTVVRPAARSVAVCQDRIAEKAFVRDLGIAVAPYAVVESAADVEDVPAELLPGILKSARLGYDGRGQVAVAEHGELAAAHALLDGAPAVLEQRVPLDLELSVVLTRDASGAVAAFPPAENRHVGGILDTSIVPARIDEALAAEAEATAVAIATALDHVGVLAVEMFVSEGRLLVNEMAPRPHNSGHATIDGHTTSQFAQQLRALCGLPLGETRAHSCTVMVNLLGDLWHPDDDAREPDWPALLAVPGAHLHLYGKAAARPGRKMGHLTVVADTLDVALARADAARRAVGLPADLRAG
jgi:5-(carboxyamino)imidazole ribonucleotide synthase